MLFNLQNYKQPTASYRLQNEKDTHTKITKEAQKGKPIPPYGNVLSRHTTYTVHGPACVVQRKRRSKWGKVLGGGGAGGAQESVHLPPEPAIAKG